MSLAGEGLGAKCKRNSMPEEMHSPSGCLLAQRGPVKKKGGLSGRSEILIGFHCTSLCPKQTWERTSSVTCSLRIATEAFLAMLKEEWGRQGNLNLGNAKTLSPQPLGGKRKHVDSDIVEFHHNPESTVQQSTEGWRVPCRITS